MDVFKIVESIVHEDLNFIQELKLYYSLYSISLDIRNLIYISPSTIFNPVKLNPNKPRLQVYPEHYDQIEKINKNVFIIKNTEVDYERSILKYATPREIEITIILSLYGIGPEIIKLYSDALILKQYISVTYNTELTESNLFKLFERVLAPPGERFALFDKIKLMHDLGIVHADLHMENIVFDTENEEYIIIDYGRSNYIKNYDWGFETMMRGDFDWDRSYLDFINNDFYNIAEYFNISDVLEKYLMKKEQFAKLGGIEYYKVRFIGPEMYIDGSCGDFALLFYRKLKERSEDAKIVALDSNDTTVYSEDNQPIHYLVRTKKGLLDGTGIYTDDQAAITIGLMSFNINSEPDYTELYLIDVELGKEESIPGWPYEYCRGLEKDVMEALNLYDNI